MRTLDVLWAHIGISWDGVLAVAVSSALMYALFVAVLQVSGPRLLTSPSAGSYAVAALFGALLGRASLGEYPTMMGGLVALTTVLALEALFGRVQKSARMAGLLGGRRAIVVLVDGVPLGDGLAHRGLTEADLMILLRRSGVQHLAEARLVILERSGGLTVVRRGQTIDGALVASVRGRERIPAELLD